MMLRSNIRIFAYLGRHKKPIHINELKTYYAMPSAHRVKPWNFNDKVLSFEDGLRYYPVSSTPAAWFIRRYSCIHLMTSSKKAGCWDSEGTLFDPKDCSNEQTFLSQIVLRYKVNLRELMISFAPGAFRRGCADWPASFLDNYNRLVSFAESEKQFSTISHHLIFN